MNNDTELQKIQRRIEELGRCRDIAVHKIADIEQYSGSLALKDLPESSPQAVAPGAAWGGRDQYCWWRIQVPELSRPEGLRLLHLKPVAGMSGETLGEGQVYWQGQAWQGVDRHHRDVPWPDGARHMSVRMWSGLQHAPRYLPEFWIVDRDGLIAQLYAETRNLCDIIELLPDNDPLLYTYRNALNRALLQLDWRQPCGGERFRISAASALSTLHEAFEDLPGLHSRPVEVTAVGHSHIDTAWLWRIRHTREKALRTFSTVLRLMEEYPEYTFAQSQPQLYQFIQQDNPSLFAAIKERVEEGRWEPVGALWVESDGNLLGGESMVRQILYGTRYFQENFGKQTRVAWLPDTFGFSAAWPQVFKKSGLEAFVTTKLSWNQTNRMPHDTFWWRGIDGSGILAHFITTPSRGADDYSTYNGEIFASTVHGLWDRYQSKEVSRNLLLAYGWGDGGGGPTRTMLDNRRMIDRYDPTIAIETGSVKNFFQQLQESRPDAILPVWDGELYLEYHRGTYTSQGRVKRTNRQMEYLLHAVETAEVINMVYRHSKPESLDSIWEVVLRNQFHDILPGSAIGEVYADTASEMAEAGKRLEHRLTELLSSSDSSGPVPGSAHWTVFNPLGISRTELVELPSPAPGAAAVIQGQPASVQPLSYEGTHAVLVRLDNIPALSAISVTLRAQRPHLEPEPNLLRASGAVMESPWARLEFDPTGAITRIWDKASGREVLPPGKRANVFQVFEDKPLNFDAWDIDAFYQEIMREVTDLQAVSVREEGPLRASVERVWNYGHSRITQRVMLYAHEPRIDFQTHIDWHEQHELLKVAFPVDIHALQARSDIQFGNVVRPIHRNTSWDEARFETVAHAWVDMAEPNYGVSLLNDSKYGHDLSYQQIRLTLIKSATAPDPQADQGEHVFTYSLLPHAGSFTEAGVHPAARCLNQPCLLQPSPNLTGPWPEGSPLFACESAHIWLETVKPAESGDGFILRFYEYGGMRGSAAITSQIPLLTWSAVNLMEEPDSAEVHAVSGGNWSMEFLPYEIRSIWVRIVDATP